MKTIAAALLLLIAGIADAQRIRPNRVPPPRSFQPPRVFNNNPIHPKATRTEGPIPFPPADRIWTRLDTPHYIFFTSGSERAARAMADDFEKLTALLLRISPYFSLPAARTRVFIFNERRDLQPYLNATRRGEPVDAIGATVRHSGGSTMLLDAGARGGDVTTPRHELVHELLQHGERPLPLWVEEGVAEYYSNAGRPIPEHASRVRSRVPISLPDLFTMTAADPRVLTPDFYAQSWALVAVLKRFDPRAFFELLRDLERGADTAESIRKHYGKTLPQIAIAMRTIGAPSLPLPMQEQSVEAEARPVSRAELLYQLATLLANVEDGDEEADRHYRAALDARPGNGEPYLRYAEFLAARQRPGEARAVAEEGLAFLQEEPRLYAIIGLDTGDVGALECARGHASRRIDIDFQLFTAYMQSGDRAKADALFAGLAETQHVNEVRRMVLRADLARADALARGGQTAEAARVLRELAEKMPGKTRSQLEEQAARLEKFN